MLVELIGVSIASGQKRNGSDLDSSSCNIIFVCCVIVYRIQGMGCSLLGIICYRDR